MNKTISPKIDKNIVIGVIVAVILVLVGIIGWSFFQKSKIPSEKEVIPEKEETIEELLKRLTPEDAKPLTEEGRRELEELLKQLTF